MGVGDDGLAHTFNPRRDGLDARASGTQPSLAITPYDDVLVQQAAKDIQQENYDEALVQLNEAWNKGTHTPEKAFLFGQVYRLCSTTPRPKNICRKPCGSSRIFVRPN